MTYWQRWTRQPRTTWLRKALFQLHLWSGIAVGLYLLFASVTGSVLVYRNELYEAASSDPMVVTRSGPLLTDDQLNGAATRAYPGYTVATLNREPDPDQAVTLNLKRGTDLKHRFFNPYTGADLGDSVSLGIRMVSKLIELHDDLLGGRTGRKVNGVGALLLLVLAFTGMFVWWPGVRKWRRSLTVQRNLGWRRFTWELHSMMGFWSLGFILLFGVSGFYLGDPQPFQDLMDRIQPVTDANLGTRVVDQFVYWLAYLHFGRINGIGIPCSGPGLCDQTVKFIWALFGLAPAAMFVTGAIMWWNRVVRKKLRRRLRHPVAETKAMEVPVR